MALGGFDFLAAEKDTSKKIEELASILENVANIFLNGVGSLEQQMEALRIRISKVETQVDTLLRVGGPGTTPAAPKLPPEPAEAPGAPSLPPAPATAPPPAAPGMPGPPPQAPTSPMGATGGLGIRAQMQGELRGFLARRRAALEAAMKDEE